MSKNVLPKADLREFRLLITGGRDFTDRAAIENALLDLEQRPDVVIHGDAAGADRVAASVAEESRDARRTF
jgi:hypothetical protein